jgi:uncharacterized SAM-binding protein YcdF (DUF218 family)
MATFKYLVGLTIHPAFIALLLVLAGVLLRRRRPRTGNTLISLGAFAAWFLSTALVGGWLLRPLESRYPAVERIPDAVKYIAVLGSDYSPRPGVPVTSSLDEAGFRRLVEGVRLLHQSPDAKLLLTGGARIPARAPATGHALLARSLGVAPASVIELTRAFNTRDEAREICRITGLEPFVLVTSAGHMPRAMEYMRRAGGKPIAAPTLQRAWPSRLSIRSWVPSADGLRMTEDALHEYLGWLALYADVP